MRISLHIKIFWLVLVIFMVLSLSIVSYAQMQYYEKGRNEVVIFNTLSIEKDKVEIRDYPIYLPVLSPVWS